MPSPVLLLAFAVLMVVVAVRMLVRQVELRGACAAPGGKVDGRAACRRPWAPARSSDSSPACSVSAGGSRWREYEGPEQRTVTFAECYERRATSRQILATKRHTDDGRARLHVLPYWGSGQVGNIRPTDIDDWTAQLSRRMSPWSVRHCCVGAAPGSEGPGDRRSVHRHRAAEEAGDPQDLRRRPHRHRGRPARHCTQEPGEKYASLRTKGRYAALAFMGAWPGPRSNEAIGLRMPPRHAAPGRSHSTGWWSTRTARKPSAGAGR